MICGDIHANVLGITYKSKVKLNRTSLSLAEHFCLWVDEVLTPLLKNQENIQKFPSCIGKGTINLMFLFSYLNFADIKKQVYELCTSVYQIKGYMKGKTLLPFPQVGVKTSKLKKHMLVSYYKDEEEIEDEARKLRESNGESFDVILKTNIEGIIVKWGHQVIS